MLLERDVNKGLQMESEGQTNFSVLARCFLPVLTISTRDVHTSLLLENQDIYLCYSYTAAIVWS